MPRFVRALLTGLAFLIFSSFGALLGYVALPLASLGIRDPERRIRRSQDVIHRWTRGYIRALRLMGLIRVDVDAPAAILRTERPSIIISNHPSLLDVMILLSVFSRMVFVVKASWLKSPFIRPLLKRGGHIAAPGSGSDQDPAGGASVFDTMVERLGRGHSVLVFPEGTRSDPGGLGSFRRGGVEAARRAGVPVVATLMRMDPPSLLRGEHWYDVPDRPMQYDIEILRVVEPEEIQSSRALARDLREQYREALGVEAQVPERPSA